MKFVLFIVLICFSFTVGISLKVPQRDQVSITIDPNNKMNIPKNFGRNESSSGRTYAIKAGYIGFSIEVWSIMHYMEQENRRPKQWFIQLMQNLKEWTGEAPPIRLGGNSGDRSWYNPNGLPKKKPIVYDVDDNYLYALQNMSATVGTRWMFGLNFDRFPNSSFAVDYAKAINRIIGKEYIKGLQIGNEPEHFDKPWDQFRDPPYTFERYLKELESYESDLLKNVPNLKADIFQGPDFCCNFLEDYSSQFIHTKKKEFNAYTYHLYPLSHCDGVVPTLQQLLDDVSVKILSEGSVFIDIAKAADIYDRDWLLGETNSVVCEGYPGVSDTFASALWALDWMFNAAYIGASNVIFHGSGVSSYSPIIIDPTGKNPYPTVMPEYYSMLMFNYMVRDYAQILDVKTSTSNSYVKVWSVINKDQTIRVLLLHKDMNAKEDAFVSIKITDPERYMASGEVIILKGNDFDMYHNSTITLAGQTLANTKTGILSGKRQVTHVHAVNGVFSLAIRPATACLFSVEKRK
jgi:hypothetical protein